MQRALAIEEEWISLEQDRTLAGRLKRFYNDSEAVVLGGFSVVVFAVAWEIVGRSGVFPPLFTSSPSAIFRAGLKLAQSGELWVHIVVSATEFAIGYGLAAVFGILLGLVTGWYRRVNYVFSPFVDALYATPRIALLPLIIIWLGIGMTPKVALVFLGAVFPLIMTTFTGMRTIDESLLKAARSFGATDRQFLTTVALPASVPYILTGLRLAVGRGLIGVIVGEMYASTAGLGFLITLAGERFQTDVVFAGVLVIAVGAMLMVQGLNRLERRFDAWRPIKT